MRLKNLYIRFYKSFNHDYLRKCDLRVVPNPWDLIEDKFYPYVKIPIDPKLTTVVGANESGKSHLLDAIEKGVSGARIERRDFCRNSQFFTSEEGKLRLPDFGFEWSGLSEAERSAIQVVCGNAGAATNRFWLFRSNGYDLSIYLPAPEGGSPQSFPLNKAQAEQLSKILPAVFRLRSNAALPERVPIRELIQGPVRVNNENRPKYIGAKQSARVIEMVTPLLEHPEWYTAAQPAGQLNAEINDFLQKLASSLTPPPDTATADEQKHEEAEFNLAYDLICKVARIDRQHLIDLDEALRQKRGTDGYAQSIIDNINQRLEAVLNFSSIWAQDREFALEVAAGRDNDLVFTIRDRTGRRYSFGERSNGLKYFLSYYVQYLAHDPKPGPEILLMDEPDAYLSSQAQQDLLRIFHKFASPEPASGRKPVQVIYVTHSPFLIDKNFAHRIRVLEKGVRDEGTRVIRDASRNHYEPLRSAFGGFFGETTYIGNCNLIVEGPADQILLTGAASHLTAQEAGVLDTLDLNDISLVSAGGAGHVSFMVLQARGRDLVASPPLIVLLDSDAGGNEAKAGLRRSKPKSGQLAEKFILQIGSLSAGDEKVQTATGRDAIEIEDLIPLGICMTAAQLYCREVCDAGESTALTITETSILEGASEGSVFDGILACFKGMTSEIAPYGLHIEKVGFAKYVIDVVEQLSLAKREGQADRLALNAETSALDQFEHNFKFLFRNLGRMQRQADSERTVERVSQKIVRTKDAFLRDHPDSATREQVTLLFERIEHDLGDDAQSDQVRQQIKQAVREFCLDTPGVIVAQEFADLQAALERIQYSDRLAAEAISRGQEAVELRSEQVSLSDQGKVLPVVEDSESRTVHPIPKLSIPTTTSELANATESLQETNSPPMMAAQEVNLPPSVQN